MADKVKFKEPTEIVQVNMDFSDRMDYYEDVDSVEVSPYKLTGSTPRPYRFELDGTHELVIQKLIGGEPSEVKALEVADDVSAILRVFETEDPVDAPEILQNNGVDPMQKSVDITLESGRDQINYLLQVDVTSTLDNMYSKELEVRVRSE